MDIISFWLETKYKTEDIDTGAKGAHEWFQFLPILASLIYLSSIKTVIYRNILLVRFSI